MEKAGTILHEGTTPQGDFVIRYLAPHDAPAMLEYINELSREKTFILFQGEQLTIEQEEAHVARQLAGIACHEVVNLLTVAGDQVIGISSIGMKGRVESHIGDFGISIAREWRGLGIGAMLMQAVLDEAREHLPNLQLVTLSVFGDNARAQHMYRRFGFVEYGRLPRGIYRGGAYSDHVYMSLDLSTANSK